MSAEEVRAKLLEIEATWSGHEQIAMQHDPEDHRNSFGIHTEQGAELEALKSVDRENQSPPVKVSPKSSPSLFRKLVAKKVLRPRRRFTVAHTW